MIKAEVIADSVNPAGCRLTTMKVTMPRMVLAEFNTHRILSRNAASSRAIPIAKFRKDVMENPAEPVFWGKNQAGMQAYTELEGEDKEAARKHWLKGRQLMLEWHEEAEKLGIHKQLANRPLEAWFYAEILVSATDWQNFFALRCHPAAMPEIQAPADAMLRAYAHSTPVQKNEGEWHLPYRSAELENLTLDDKIRVCVARAARLSYKKFDGTSSVSDDLELVDTLSKSGHWSPFEHVARATSGGGFFGNFRGWIQLRKQYLGENRRVDVAELLEQRIAAGSKYAAGTA